MSFCLIRTSTIPYENFTVQITPTFYTSLVINKKPPKISQILTIYKPWVLLFKYHSVQLLFGEITRFPCYNHEVSNENAKLSTFTIISWNDDRKLRKTPKI